MRPCQVYIEPKSEDPNVDDGAEKFVAEMIVALIKSLLINVCHRLHQ